MIENQEPTTNLEIPLIYTSKGNIPVDSLKYETKWTVTSEYIMFNEAWYLEDELVKSNSHAYGANPLGQLSSDTGTF
jgi:hypothetical protein